MATFEATIYRLHIGEIDTIEPRRLRWSTRGGRQLEIEATDGTVIEADMPKHAAPDAMELLEFAWLCLTYGAEGDNYETALADLRAAKAAHDARAAAERAE